MGLIIITTHNFERVYTTQKGVRKGRASPFLSRKFFAKVFFKFYFLR